MDPKNIRQGDRYGEWTVVETSPPYNGEIWLRLRCICGARADLPASGLDRMPSSCTHVAAAIEESKKTGGGRCARKRYAKTRRLRPKHRRKLVPGAPDRHVVKLESIPRDLPGSAWVGTEFVG